MGYYRTIHDFSAVHPAARRPTLPYTCTTPTCAIALSKAAFPVAMNCPVCAQPLVEAYTFGLGEGGEGKYKGQGREQYPAHHGTMCVHA